MTPTELTFFDFEADFVQSLRCIPMQVRYKLDTCGIKLKLAQWHRFTTAERETLVALPCETGLQISVYRDYLQSLITQQGEAAKDIPIDPQPPWQEHKRVPAEVEGQAKQVGVSLTPEHWKSLTPLQRFALCKLSRAGHENRNFLPALKEFNL